MDLLTRLIRENRTKKRLTQFQLGERVGVSRVTIQQLETGAGKKSGSLSLLDGIRRELAPETPLSLWAIASLERTVSRSTEVGDDVQATLRSDLSKAADLLTPRGTVINPLPKSLAGFPVGFEGLTVVVGDRREEPPITRGDLMVGSASPEDLRYILAAGLTDPHSIIQTDKVIVNTMNEDDLHRVFGRSHLLIIGSPFVNLMARVMNRLTPFKFQPLGPMRAWNENLDGIRRIQGYELNAFSELSQGVKKRKQTGKNSNEGQHLEQLVDRLSQGLPTKSLKELFRPTGLVDPVELDTYGVTRASDSSYGIISLTHNPYADSQDFFAVSVAGIHRPSTMMALKALAGGDFSEHPLGGVIEVVQPPGQAEESWWSWKTPAYTVPDLIGNLEAGLDPDPGERPTLFDDWDSSEIENCLELCRSVS